MAIWRTSGMWAAIFIFASTAAGQTHTLVESPRPGDCNKYELSMTLKGELRVSREGKVVPIPINASAEHRFSERVLEAKEKGLPEKVARYYEQARSHVAVDGSNLARQVRDERRLIVAQRPHDQFLCYSPRGALTNEELELISEHFDTLTLAGLLPQSSVSTGDTWKIRNETVQALCQFEALISHELTGKLDEVSDGFASISVGGKASGIEVGALAKITVSAKVRYEILPKRLVSVEWTQKDERDQGPASPAGTIEATTIVKRASIDQPRELTDLALESVPPGFEPPTALTLIYHRDNQSRYDVAASRDWHLVAQTDQHLVLRLIDRGDLIAQLSLTPWTKADKGKHISPEEFKDVVSNAPGWQLEEILEAGPVPVENGVWTYRISARGMMEETKVIQTVYVVANADGDQVVAAFTMKPGQVGKLGSRDLTLVGSIGFPKK
jgi:hypothetical protein